MSAAPAPTAGQHRLTRWVFLRALGVVYLIAFASLWWQVTGLIGARGILPIADYLERAHAALGSRAYAELPTLFWLGASDAWLHALCGAGCLGALLLIAGVAAAPVCGLLWALYLSLTVAGQTFLGFQWDSLLLETGLAAVLFAPLTLAPRWPAHEPPISRAALWLLRLLLFKLMVLSGAVKLVCLDPTWWGLSALDYHYFTQPLPTWVAWFAAKAPPLVQHLSVAIMFAIELGVPFTMFGPRLMRRLGAAALVLLQFVIALTGNYGFFNLLTVVLCLPLLDDALLVRTVPRRWRARFATVDAAVPPRASRPGSAIRAVAVAALLVLSTLTFLRELVRTAPPELGGVVGKTLGWSERTVLSFGDPLLEKIDPFRSVNGYGLFRAMTTSRPEIVIEGSEDGQAWREYAFRWKPGDVARRPGFVAPYMPRLDWQMWFAALSPRHAESWLGSLLLALLEGRPEVLALLEQPPFDPPPRFVRLVQYEYQFTSAAERAQTGAWWRRNALGNLTESLSLASFGKVR